MQDKTSDALPELARREPELTKTRRSKYRTAFWFTVPPVLLACGSLALVEYLAPSGLPEIMRPSSWVDAARGVADKRAEGAGTHSNDGDIEGGIAAAVRAKQALGLQDPARQRSIDDINELERRLVEFQPELIAIPGATPDPSKIKTVRELLEPSEESDLSSSPLMGYAMGKDGLSPEMEQAIRTVRNAKEGKFTNMSPQQVAEYASARIGYVPAGVDPQMVRTPGGRLEGEGRDVLTGFPEAETGDTLSIGGRKLRLKAVRAPRNEDLCTNSVGGEYNCALWSREGMRHILAGEEISCAVIGALDEDGIGYGWCNIVAGGRSLDLASVAVKAGILLTVPDENGDDIYDIELELAKAKKRGLWSGAITDRPVIPGDLGPDFIGPILQDDRDVPGEPDDLHVGQVAAGEEPANLDEPREEKSEDKQTDTAKSNK